MTTVTVREATIGPPQAFRDDHGIREPRLDGATAPQRLPGRLPLRVGLTGGLGPGDSDRACAGRGERGVRQPAHGAGARERDGRDGYGLLEQDAAGRHRRAAGPAARRPGAAALRRVGGSREALRQAELRAAAGRRRAVRVATGLPHRDAASAGSGISLDPDGRLGR